MDNIGEFITELAERQDPHYRDIATNALDRWTETGTISPKMALWIRRSARFKGMKMPKELKQLIGEFVDDEEGETEAEQHCMPIRPALTFEAVFFEEMATAFARVAERLRILHGAKTKHHH